MTTNSGPASSLEGALRERIRQEEASHSRSDRDPDTLWGHLERVACIAEQIGRAEGVDVELCRLAALFHDAGKFAGGRYHQDAEPEERHAVSVLRELASDHGLAPGSVEVVSEAILQLYRDDPDPTPLARVVFDADNLDKLGPLGLANFFVKTGLRGQGVCSRVLQRLTLELTYARHAPRCLWTATGRARAEPRARQTTELVHQLLDTLREDALFDLRVRQLELEGLVVDLVEPAACECGGPLESRAWETPGLKCSEIHIELSCASCSTRLEIRFCRPRLIAPAESS